MALINQHCVFCKFCARESGARHRERPREETPLTCALYSFIELSTAGVDALLVSKVVAETIPTLEIGMMCALLSGFVAVTICASEGRHILWPASKDGRRACIDTILGEC